VGGAFVLAAFADKRHGLLRPDARALLAAAPTPARGRGAEQDPTAGPAAPRGPTTRHRSRRRAPPGDTARRVPAPTPLVEHALGQQALALLRHSTQPAPTPTSLATAVIEHFETHPYAAIIAGQPGLGALTGARVLAEIGDDRSRFSDARTLNSYAGAAPVTRASGKTLAVMHRRIKNHRLADAGYQWASTALTASSGARTHYDPADMPVTITPPRSATCSTASSAACTTAWPPASATRRPLPSTYGSRDHQEASRAAASA